ncbi:MAG: PIN domain-containing protein [Limnothrix sp. RL_2_0]|nr:PIN domain-containing protein [Limnothrix sp. RL_2_0]
MAKGLRWCLDLNIWCAALLADLKGTHDSACQNLVEIVQNGHCNEVPVQLVISWGMLNRLQQVLMRLGIRANDAANYVDVIRAYGSLDPSVTLGGTGIIPLQDEEDRHVLETALAGKADVLVTANFSDFLSKETSEVMINRHYRYLAPNQSLEILHPYLLMEWVRLDVVLKNLS